VADGDSPPSTNQSDNGQAQVRLNSQAQKLSGITTTTLKAANHQAEFTAYGKAVNIQALLALRHRHLVALTERNSAKAKFKQAEQSINRQQDLYRGGISSKRLLQEQQAQWQTYQAQVDATAAQGLAVIDEALLLWGKTLTDWVLSSEPAQLDAFLSGRKKLLQITLPTNKHLPDTVTAIDIDASGNRSKARPAMLVSAAVATETSAQGETYYFQTDAPNIITGMNVVAWIPEQDTQMSGVIIPKTALLLYRDQVFVYLKTTEEAFIRRAINNYFATADGYFISGPLKPGEQVVSKGAQMLLSEELRGQIPDEDAN
jgi:hypothetical protein